MKEEKIYDADANMPDELIKEVKKTKIMRTFTKLPLSLLRPEHWILNKQDTRKHFMTG